MKLLVSVILGILVFGIGTIQHANSELLPDQTYQLHALGFYSDTKSIGNSNLDLKFSLTKDSENKKTLLINEGVANLSGQNYTILGNWKAVLLNDDRVSLVSGDAQNSEGKLITIRISGKLVENNEEGSVYSFTGKIDGGGQSMKTVYVAKISALEPTKPVSTQEKETGNKATSETKQPILKLMLITKQWDRVQVSDSYRITTKVYDADKNPTKDFNQNDGAVAEAKITVKIVDINRIVVKSFEGVTDKFGYFSDGFRLQDNFKPGTYKVVVNATKGTFSTTDELILHVFGYSLQYNSTNLNP